MENDIPELGGRGTDSPLHPHGELKGTRQKHRRTTFLAGAMLFLMALLIGAVGVGVYVYSKMPDKGRPRHTKVEQAAEAPVAQKETASVNLANDPYSGLYGASVIEMDMDFAAGTGTRFYRADPGNVFTLRITQATPLGNGEYHVEITEFIESRIKVGVYKGVITDSDFNGIYTSTHGEQREFHLTR